MSLTLLLFSVSIPVGDNLSQEQDISFLLILKNTCCSVSHLVFIVFWLQLIHKCH